MPNNKQHCRISKKETGEEFSELHEWMDAPQKELGISHRTERHDTSHIPFVKKKWGAEGVREFLRHIEEDYKHTREKWGRPCATQGCEKYTWHKRKYCNTCIRERKNGRQKIKGNN
jgi:hypothetical protein